MLDGEDDLAGLPDSRAAAQAAAAERGLAGKHVITLRVRASRAVPAVLRPRSAREDLSRLIARGDGGGATDNKAIIAEMVAPRAERAAARLSDALPITGRRRHGQDAGGGAFAARARVAARAQPRHEDAVALRARCRMKERISRSPRDGATTGELRKVRCDIDDGDQAVLPARPHHRGGVLHRQLPFGPTFERREGIPVWHDDVRYEVRDAAGRHRGLSFGDYFARGSHSGA